MRRSDRLIISPTGLGTWRFCPQKWRYRYDEGLRDRRESGRLSVGNVQHVALEALAQGSDPGEQARAWVAGRRWDTPPSEAQVSEGLDGAREIWRLVARLWPGATLEGIEEEVYADLSPEVRVGGKADLVLVTERGSRVLVDYKRRGRLQHAKPIETVGTWDLAAARHTTTDVQAHIYALALAGLGRPVDESYRLESTAGGSQVRILRTSPTPETLALAAAEVLGTAALMRGPASPADRYYPAEGSCYSYGAPCEYAQICAADRQGTPTEDLRAPLRRVDAPAEAR